MSLTEKDWQEIKSQSEDMIKRLTKDSEISIIASKLMLEEANNQIEMLKCQTIQKPSRQSN